MKDILAGFLAGCREYFKAVWRQKAGRMLLILAVVLILAAIGVWVNIYLEGNVAANNAFFAVGRI